MMQRTLSGVRNEFSSSGSSLVMVVTRPALSNASPAMLSSDTLIFWAAVPKLTICSAHWGKNRSGSRFQNTVIGNVC